MNPRAEQTLDVHDIPRVVSKYWISILITSLITTSLAVVAAPHLKKRFKSHFVLTISSKYFQNPLVGDLVPALSESADPRSQREALIRQVLTPEYLDEIGTKYGIYRSSQAASGSSSIFHWAKINGPASLFQADGGAARLATERDAM